MLVRVIICSTAVILTILTGRVTSSDHLTSFDIDSDDEDHFGTANEGTYLRDDFYRKRRSQEEGFYHTLLSRSEPQHVFKRSGGTEDFARSKSKAMFVTERDWTGSSKISDADRKELEALFSKLNADDGPVKNDVTRSLPDEDGDVSTMSPIDRAAYRYAAWLMSQPSHQFAHALTEKAHVDNRLTRLFFEKRGLDLVLPNAEPMTNDKRSHVTNAADSAQLLPVAGAAVIANSTAKHLIMSGPKLCTDDSAKCLCTRACYPINIDSVTPCKCAGKTPPQAITQRSNTTTAAATADTKQTVPQAAASFPPQAPAAVKASVASFPPQAPAVVNSPSLIASKQSPAPLLQNGTVAMAAPVAIVTDTNKATNATVKSAVTGATPPLLVAAQPALVKADNLTSVEPAESKSIEPIRSTRYFKGGIPPPAAAAPAAAGSTAGARQLPSNETAGLFGSNKPIYLDHPSYQGCYKDRKPVRDLPKRYTRFDTTPESCIMECKYQNYNFAGVQYGYLCFCGNAFGRYGRVSDKDCNSFCNGDNKRKCGAFWHNSVYSVDGRHYDPGVFDYAKVDEEERIHDELSPTPVKVQKKSDTKVDEHINSQGANAATHLMDAAQATLKAAKKLLPGVSKKHKIGKDGSKRGKRGDDEDDEELMYERENALSSLKQAHNILQKTNFEKVRRSAEKEKRSISEDFDPYDPDDGKDVLKAYMSSVDAYRRQTRSVDDDEEDDADVSNKDNFIYRRLSESDLQEGTFVDKLEDNSVEAQDQNTETYPAKRSAEKDVTVNAAAKKTEKEKRSTVEEKKETPAPVPVKRDVGGDEPIEQKKVEPIVQSEHVEEKREVRQGSGGGEDKKKRSAEESVVKVAGSGDWNKKKRSISETVQKVHAASGDWNRKKRRSLGENVQKLRAGSGEWKKKRSIVDTIQKVHASGDWSMKKKRSTEESVVAKVHAGSGGGFKRKRSVGESVVKMQGSGDGMKKRRSLSLDSNIEALRSTLAEASRPQPPVFNADNAATMKARRDVTSATRKVVKRRSGVKKTKVANEVGEKRVLKVLKTPVQKAQPKPDAEVPWDRKRKRRSLDDMEDDYISRSKREVASNNLSDGALKMAARSSDINDIEKSLQGLESIEKRDQIPEEEKSEDDSAASEDSDESGGGESDESDEELSGDESKKVVQDNNEDEENKTVKKRSADTSTQADEEPAKKSTTSTKETKSSGEVVVEDAKLKSDVEKGVDSLLNLVVELYKQQKTIKNFENSVRTLRHDILKELKIPAKDKHAATKKVRNAIQSAAKERLHTLTSSIEHKITEFAKRHPDSVKQAKLATSLLPKIPLTDQKLVEQKREITRRAAEFDDMEDAWSSQQVPDILKEHFKRNAERDVEDDFDRGMSKRNSEEDVEYEAPAPKAKDEVSVSKRSLGEKKERQVTEVNGERTLSRMHRDVSESEEEGVFDDDQDDDDYEKLFN